MIRISKEKVLLLHQLIAQETGGSIGVRDEGLLESALEGAFATLDGQELYPSKEEKGARIGYTVALGCILFVVLHLFYLIYLLIEKLQDRRDRR